MVRDPRAPEGGGPRVPGGRGTGDAHGRRTGSQLFSGEWLPPLTEGNLTSRAMAGASSTLLLPLLPDRDYRVTLRADPFPRPDEGFAGPLPMLEVRSGTQTLLEVPLQWDPQRVGAYTFDIPRSLVNRRVTAISLAAHLQAERARVRVWYARVHPILPPP